MANWQIKYFLWLVIDCHSDKLSSTRRTTRKKGDLCSESQTMNRKCFNRVCFFHRHVIMCCRWRTAYIVEFCTALKRRLGISYLGRGGPLTPIRVCRLVVVSGGNGVAGRLTTRVCKLCPCPPRRFSKQRTTAAVFVWCLNGSLHCGFAFFCVLSRNILISLLGRLHLLLR